VRSEPSVQALFQSPCWHLTHDGEPRGERQAKSSQRSENCLSDSEPAARRETNSSAGSTRDFALFSLDEQQKFTAETIEIRKMAYTYRKKVIDTPEDEYHLAAPG
jgi:hypothetical protein